MSSKVDCIILGAMKSGTTSLYHLLSQHPEIDVGWKSEMNFFNKYINYNDHINEYESYFNKNRKINIEVSTSYTARLDENNRVYNRIKNYNSQMKFIYIIREPFDRTLSHYMHVYQTGSIDEKDFNKALFIYPELIARSKYFSQIKPFVDEFGKGSILLITSDELRSNNKKTLRKIFEFLNVDDIADKLLYEERNKWNNSVKVHRKFFPVINKLIKLNNLLPKAFQDLLKKLFYYFQLLLYRETKRFNDKPQYSKESLEILNEIFIKELKNLEYIFEIDLSTWYNNYSYDEVLKAN